MYLAKNLDNNIASRGYHTGYPFMTVHCNSEGLYVAKELPGYEEYYSEASECIVKRIKNNTSDPYMSLGVYRTDLPAGRTHTVSGFISNVYVPVNFTINAIPRHEFIFIFDIAHRETKHQYVYMNRSDRVINKNGILRDEELLRWYIERDTPASEDLSRYDFMVGDIEVTVWIPGKSKFVVNPFSNSGKRLIACLCSFIKRPIERALSIIPLENYKQFYVNSKWKILRNENDEWYKWTYINGSVIPFEKIEPDWFTDNGTEKFICSEINQYGDIICTLFSKNGRSKDVKIPKKYHFENPCFDLRETVLRMAPNSMFVIEQTRMGNHF